MLHHPGVRVLGDALGLQASPKMLPVVHGREKLETRLLAKSCRINRCILQRGYYIFHQLITGYAALPPNKIGRGCEAGGSFTEIGISK